MSTNLLPKNPKPSERRRRSRSKALLMADVKDLSTGRLFTAVTKNLSGTGVCLIGDLPIERGRKLQLAIDLPDQSGPLTVIGEVVWIMTVRATDIHATERGVKFTGLKPQARKLLERIFD